MLSWWCKINRLELLLTVHPWNQINQGVCLGLSFACWLCLQSLVAQLPHVQATLPTWPTLLANLGLGTHLPCFLIYSNCAPIVCLSDSRLSELSELLMIFCPPVSPSNIAYLNCKVLRLDDRPPTICDLFSQCLANRLGSNLFRLCVDLDLAFFVLDKLG